MMKALFLFRSVLYKFVILLFDVRHNDDSLSHIRLLFQYLIFSDNPHFLNKEYRLHVHLEVGVMFINEYLLVTNRNDKIAMKIVFHKCVCLQKFHMFFYVIFVICNVFYS